MRRGRALALAAVVLLACGRRREPAAPPMAGYGSQPDPAPAPATGVAPPMTSPPPRAAPPMPPRDHGEGYAPSVAPLERGEASYYHHSLAGNRTACGEVYDPRLLTAAHRKLPFGTLIDVVRSDGRWVRVRVNDRGPFVKGRVVDVSGRAAELIGLVQPGVAEVTIYRAR